MIWSNLGTETILMRHYLIKMEVGEDVVYLADDNVERLCEIFAVHTYKDPKTRKEYYSYDILYPERNVPLEALDVPIDQLKRGDIINYQRSNKNYEAYISKIDWASSSVQLRIIKRYVN